MSGSPCEILNVHRGWQSWGLDAGGVEIGQGGRRDFVKSERGGERRPAGVKTSVANLNHVVYIGAIFDTGVRIQGCFRPAVWTRMQAGADCSKVFRRVGRNPTWELFCPWLPGAEGLFGFFMELGNPFYITMIKPKAILGCVDSCCIK